jgi:hypothetical protein
MINKYDYFEVELPACHNLPGGDSIRLCVKHGVSAADDNMIACEVWARVGDLSLSGLIMTFTIDKPEGNSTNDVKILNYLNGDGANDFDEALSAFVDWHIQNVGMD